MPTTFAGCVLDHIDDLPVLWRRDDRFKTFRLVLCWQRPLDERAAARALLPALLLHGTQRFPDRPALARAMERCYGAWAGPGVGRFAESQVFRLATEAVAGEFLPGRPDQLGEMMGLLAEFALRPRLEHGRFAADAFGREHEQALAQARAVIDDKAAWARQRAIALGCIGEPWAIPDHGGEAAIAALTPADPELVRHDFLVHGRRWCVAMGALPADLPQRLAAWLPALPRQQPLPLPAVAQPMPRAPGRTVEHAVMQQARIVLLFRFPVPIDAAGAAAMQVLASLWGGGPHSRLFREVREQRSLCYAIGAGGDVHKGVVLVTVGCDAPACPAVVAEVQRQLALLAAGEFAAQELQTAIATIVGPFLAVDDSLAGRMQFTAEQWLLGRDQEPGQRIDGYRAVSRAAVIAAAQSIWLDHEYLLLPEGA
ncbi:MAG: insulinase family protein [Planctomycetes bacterium]|nr:insulinase family protein [Planctomycetota bacterium]